MAESDKGVVGLLIAGIGYAFIKLADEFVVMLDEIFLLVDDVFSLFGDSLFLRLSIDDIIEQLFALDISVDVSLETIVLSFLAFFLLFAIVNYVSEEM